MVVVWFGIIKNISSGSSRDFDAVCGQGYGILYVV